MQIIGREKEQDTLRACYESEKAEFIAVYGRRHVGKTFLIKNFSMTGSTVPAPYPPD